MFKKLLSVAVLSTALSACQPASQAPELQIENASFRAPLPGQTTAVAYFDIVNTGGQDVLLSASSNVSERVEIHDHLHEGGVMKMRQVNSVDIAKNSKTSFKSGGLHVMFFETDMIEPVTLTLDFENHDDLTIQMIANIN